ncbi:hypothetical protein AB0159_24485 [Klebsiella pneumoniae]|uniref:hypothetical protein n=1 Tax=Klebsiella pneumoniae TaxID=573 RepID=UPI00209D202F|nr:hypothetical protein [Klebsiella pneumoniae]MCP1024093.1 hypothetical protein [Klebsiella pneumoniae]HBS2295348.1 hypothetical protein [Klebsiella pneumoniae]
MTDITELALRLKLEVHRAVSNFNPQMNIKTRDLMELVEALEKAQQRIVELDRKNCELDSLTQRWAVERAENADRIAELESRIVTVKLTDINEYLAEVHDKTLNRAFRLLAEGVRSGDVAAMRAAGIKVEAG